MAEKKATTSKKTTPAKKAAPKKPAEEAVPPPSPSEQGAIDQQQKQKKKSHWPWGVWASLFLALGIFLIPQILLLQILPRDLLDEISTGRNATLNFMILVAGEVGSFGLLVAVLNSKRKSLANIFVRPAKIADVLLAIPVMAIYQFIVTVTIAIILPILSEEQLNSEQDIGFDVSAVSDGEQILVFIGLVLLVPFIEEALFRGFMLRGFASRLGWYPAMILTSALFGLAHFQGEEQLILVLDTFVLGLAASWLVYFSRSLWPAVLLHTLKNGLAFAVVFKYIEF